MSNNELNVDKGDFIELKFTGYVEGKPFDSNVAEDLKKVNPKAEPEKTLLIVGEKMVVPGLDNALIGKELNREYSVLVHFKDAFGPRNTSLVKTIPLKMFAQQRVAPRPGSVFVFDNQLARIIAVSGARVITDFNNPLAGKDLEYKFTVTRKVSDLKEKTEAVCKLIFRFVPEIEIDGQKVTLRGPKILEEFVKRNQNKFKELLNTEVHFKEEVTKEESQVAK